jgi:hypothetical protein
VITHFVARAQEIATPLHLACELQTSTDVVDALLELEPGCIELTNQQGETPLLVALGSFRAQLSFVQHLLTRWGADVKATRPYGNQRRDVLSSLLEVSPSFSLIDVYMSYGRWPKGFTDTHTHTSIDQMRRR